MTKHEQTKIESSTRLRMQTWIHLDLTGKVNQGHFVKAKLLSSSQAFLKVDRRANQGPTRMQLPRSLWSFALHFTCTGSALGTVLGCPNKLLVEQGLDAYAFVALVRKKWWVKRLIPFWFNPGILFSTPRNLRGSHLHQNLWPIRFFDRFLWTVVSTTAPSLARLKFSYIYFHC